MVGHRSVGAAGLPVVLLAVRSAASSAAGLVAQKDCQTKE